MARHMMSQRAFWSEMRPGRLLSFTNAIAYWQKRAKIFKKQHFTQFTKMARVGKGTLSPPYPPAYGQPDLHSCCRHNQYHRGSASTRPNSDSNPSRTETHAASVSSPV